MPKLQTPLKAITLRKYVPSPTARMFHASTKLIRCIKGPVGSGKSVMGAMELFSRALEQRPNADGVRKTRFAIVRNTYPELSTTTLNTVKDWIPEGVMKYKASPPLSGIMDLPLSDGTRVFSEWLFIALDDESDIKKLKSLEVTMIWLNEASEISRPILDMATTRLRYPAPIEGGATFQGVIADSNPPDDLHWIYKLGEVEKPDEFALFNQPPAVLRITSKDSTIKYVQNDGNHSWYKGPPAENIENLGGGWDYYMRPLAAGKDHAWVRVFFMGEYGTTATGKPVFFEYNDTLHYTKDPVVPYKAAPLVLGWDFGLNASCVFGQLTPKGGINLIDELTSEDMGIERFVKDRVIPRIKSEYPELRILGCGDPAGAQRSQTTEVTCFQILLENGFDVIPALTNEFAARREAVAYFLTRLIDGKPGFVISSKCPILRKALAGNYQYRRMRIGSGDRFTDRPDKNEYSHLADALQYLCLYFRDVGAGGRGKVIEMEEYPGFGSRADVAPPRKANFSSWV